MDENNTIVEAVGSNISPWKEGTKQYVEGRDTVTETSDVSLDLFNSKFGTHQPAQERTFTFRKPGSTTPQTHIVRGYERNFSYTDATQRNDIEEWLHSMDIEFEKIQGNTVWDRRLPFSNYDLYVNSHTAGSFAPDNLLRFSNYNNTSDVWNGIEGSPSVGLGGADIIFSFITNDNYIGYVLYFFRSDTQQLNVYSYLLRREDLDFIGTYDKINIALPDNIFGNPANTGGFNLGVGASINALSSDVINRPTMPQIGVSTSGFINVYKVDRDALTTLGSELFTDVNIDNIIEQPTQVQTIQDLASSFLATGVNLGTSVRIAQQTGENAAKGKLLEYILDVHCLPCTPSTQSTASRIDVGPRQLQSVGYKCTSDYVDVDAGTIHIAPVYNSFLDYSTIYKLYLPFIGFVNISPDYCVNANLHLYYRFNIIDGTCIAYVSCTKQGFSGVIAEYTGSCCMHLPLTGENYAQLLSGYAQQMTSGAASVAGAIGGIVTGNPLMAVAGLGSAFGNAVNNQIQNSINPNYGSTPSTNGYNCSSSFMGKRRPYLLMEIPVQQVPSNYYHTVGAPAQINIKLSSLKGFAQINNIDMSGVNGIDEAERDEIRQLLANGVYF